MPTYEYRCKECSKEYDVFHKVREIEEDIICPVCQSTAHIRLMSASGVSMKGYSSSSTSSADTYGSGNCCGGSCSVT